MGVNHVTNYPPVTPPPQPAGAERAPAVNVDAPAPVPGPGTVEVPRNRDAERNETAIEQLEIAVAEINQTISSYHRHLSVTLHQATGRHMVTVYDTDTSEVIREIPPQRVLDAHASLLEMAGLMVDTRG